MHEIPNIITERVDDMPLLLDQRQRMELPTLMDTHLPAHGTWEGLSLGWVSTLWLSAIFSRGDHRLVPVAPWVAHRLFTLQTVTGQAVERLDCTDERLASVLRHVRDDTRGGQCASRGPQHTVRVDDLSPERLHVDSPTARAEASVSPEGCLQWGHGKADRPDVPQGTVMHAVLAPVGRPLATDVVSGERADAPLSVPCIARVQTSVGRSGLWCVGAGQRAAHATRAFIAWAGAASFCPLPHVHLAEGELEGALERVWSGAHALLSVLRAPEQGESKLLAQGYASEVPMRMAGEGPARAWRERRLVVRSVRHAEAAEVALRARVAQAQAQVEALNLRGRGRWRVAEIAA